MKSGKILRWRTIQPTDEKTARRIIMEKLVNALESYDSFVQRKRHRNSIIRDVIDVIRQHCIHSCEIIIINQ